MQSPSQTTSQAHAPVFVPGSPFQLGMEALLGAAFHGVDLNPLRETLIAHLTAHPDDAQAYMDLAILVQLTHNDAVAASIQLEGLRLRRHFQLPTAAVAPSVRMLAVMAPGNFMANTPLEFLVSHTDIALDTYYVLPGEPLPETLPPHDVLFVAVGESSATSGLLADLCEAVTGWDKPLLNHPMHSLFLGRDSVSNMVADADACYMPRTAELPRAVVEQIASGADATAWLADARWPLIVRPLGSHAGKDLDKIDTPAALGDYLQQHAGVDSFYLSSFVDYRSAGDGLYRKYRIVLVQGKPFLCHMAISSKWMVHYLNADMTEDAGRRGEEARVMGSFDDDFAVRHARAFAQLYETFPLDYFGFDCGETQDGRLLIFEVDTGMIVHAMDPEDMFPYKKVAMRRVFDAFQQMVRTAAAGEGS